jgi:predicted RNA-binding protein
MGNELIVKNIETSLIDCKPEYRTMLENIEEKMPEVQHACSNFYKSHSQFMYVTLDVTAISPIRSIKHSLAEVERTKTALQDAHINMQKKVIKLKKKERKLEKCKDDLDRKMLEVEILELRTHSTNAQNFVQGAIRKLNFFVNQYESLLKHLGITEVTEEMYEREEARYHVMTAMKQAFSAARTKGGVIDEGNHIYFFDLGINGAAAQVELFNYLKIENAMIAKGEEPSHEMTMQWLEKCADKFEKDPQKFTVRRGFKILDKQSLTNTPHLEAAE